MADANDYLSLMEAACRRQGRGYPGNEGPSRGRLLSPGCGLVTSAGWPHCRGASLQT